MSFLKSRNEEPNKTPRPTLNKTSKTPYLYLDLTVKYLSEHVRQNTAEPSVAELTKGKYIEQTTVRRFDHQARGNDRIRNSQFHVLLISLPRR